MSGEKDRNLQGKARQGAQEKEEKKKTSRYASDDIVIIFISCG
jgi:hypothetical protein